jgi:hypothetical protein
MGWDPGEQQLVDPESHGIERRRVDAIQRPIGGDGDDRVDRVARAQGAIGQLGRERRVAPTQPHLPQHRGKDQVRVRVVAVYGRDRLVRGLSGGVNSAPACARIAATPIVATRVADGPPLTRPPLWPRHRTAPASPTAGEAA